MILLQIQEFKDIRVPRFQIDGNRAFSFPSSLIDVACRVVVHSKHGYDTIRGSIGASDIGTRSADIVNRQSNSTSVLGDDGALLEGFVDAVNGIFLHRDQETGGQLRLLRAGIV